MIYGDVNSGNCYKVKLLAEQLALPYTWVGIDTLKKETQSDEFLNKNLERQNSITRDSGWQVSPGIERDTSLSR